MPDVEVACVLQRVGKSSTGRESRKGALAMESTITAQQLFEPGLAARIRARARHRLLDRELSNGANPADCSDWAARAAELTKRSSRERAADEVEQLIRFGEQQHRVKLGPHPAAARVNREVLEQLAALLRDDAPLYARGLARLQVALSDGAGPVYTDRDGRALARELRNVHAALMG